MTTAAPQFRLRPIMVSDLDVVTGIEQDPLCRPHITPWERIQHEGAVRMAFRDLQAHRFWLDVKARNTRAKALYESEGFVAEGLLRESVKTDDGYDSLLVMAMLACEFEARLAQGLEAAAA